MTILIKTIPFLPMSANDHVRAHWATISKEKGDLSLLIPKAHGSDVQQSDDPPRRVELVFRKSRGPLASDDDNRNFRAKSVLDALVRNCWLFDDSPHYCRLTVREERGQTATVIAVSEIVEAAA